jgi:SAM-dependent methyltransferase
VASDAFAAAAEAAAARYAPAGRFAVGLARGKMRSDPVYRALMERGIADAASVTDLGCGRGYLLALILESRAGSPPPRLCGVEIAARAAHHARLACGEQASISQADLASAAVPRSEAVALIDVLHYLPGAAQDALLERACAALEPGGRLFVRDADAGAGAGFLAVRFSERLAALARGEGFRPFDFRRGEEWVRRLEACGTSVASRPMGAGTPFANILLEARRLA